MKPRSNCVLKNLPRKKQEQIWKWLSGDSAKNLPALSQKRAAAKIRESWGLKVSPGQLSRFYAWYPFSQELLGARNFAQDISEYIRSNPDIDLDSQQVSKLGQLIYEKLAVGSNNAKLYVELRKLRQKDQELAFMREKFAATTSEFFLKWYRDEKTRAIAESTASNPEKIAQLIRIYFKDVDDLERSGSVKLPE